MQPFWQGVFPAVTTQFRRDQGLDLEATARHLEVLLDSGVSGLIVCGSLGENQTLDPDEKRRIVELAVRVAKGRVPVLSGVAETSTAAACRYVRDCEKLGAGGFMVMPAMIYRADRRETLAYFRTVAGATGLPWMLYNNPVAYTVDVTADMFHELADLKNLVAIKESSANPRRITELRLAVNDRFALFVGVDDLILESAILGIDGWVAGSGIAFPGGPLGRSADALPLVLPASAARHAREVRAVHQAGGAGSGAGRRVGPRPAADTGRRGARTRAIDYPPWHRNATAACGLAFAMPKRVQAAYQRTLSRKRQTLMSHLIHVVDSHSAGEPTRVVIGGGPDLGGGSVAQQLDAFRERFDHYRSAIVNEPRGSDVLVGALLCPASEPGCAAGVIFFNNVGYLGMCGHGAIGVVATLAHHKRLGAGEHRLETPVGVVTTTLHADGSVSVANVPSWRKANGVTVDVPQVGRITGDVAWGGNWFFLVAGAEPFNLADVERLTEKTRRIRQAVNAAGFPEVDHVELFGPPLQATSQSRNFVLCPGNAYDRSPCGTGTSAKLACLAAEGTLAEDEPWVQESILGSTFTGRYRWLDRAAGRIVPTITGRAFITADATLFLDDADPFCWGIRAEKTP